MIACNQIDTLPPSITADHLRVYLQVRGWREDGKIRGIATIWHRDNSEDAEVLLPSLSAKDYRPRMQQALRAIAQHEKRTTGEIIKDVLSQLSNVITVRVIHEDTTDGTIPISDGVLLITKAKELMASAAQSVYLKKKHFTGNFTREAKEYLEKLRLGQTEIGSYVVNIIAPIEINSSSQERIVEPISLSQAITTNLVAGLGALERASEKYEKTGDLKEFDQAVHEGVSANMCDALLGFSGEERKREFEVSVYGIASQILPCEVKKFNFSRVDLEILESVSGYYKDDYVVPAVNLIGYITKLAKAADDMTGTVVIDPLFGGIEKKVKVTLEGLEYHEAVLAHDKSKLVKIIGDVHVKSKSATMINHSGLSIIDSNDLLA